MIDFGKKHGLIEGMPKGDDDKKYYPSLSVPLSLVEGKKIGESCRIEIVGEITSMEKRKDYSEAMIEVKSGKYISKAGKVTKDEYKKMSDKEREAYDKEDIGV